MEVRRRRASSRGFEISYEQVGAGSCLVLIPAWLQDATDWHSQGSPSIPAGKYVDRLASTYEVIAVDPLGHGCSDKPHDWQAYQLPDLAADLVAPLDAAGIDRAVFWGYSRGAYLAAVVAAEFPDRVTALIAGANPLTHQGWPADWIESMRSGGWPRFWALKPFDFALDRSWAQDNDPLALAAQMEGETRSLSTQGKARPSPPYRFDLNRIASPSLLYCGGEDSPENMRPTADHMGVTLHLLEGLNHVQGFTEADQVLELVLPFLAAHAESQLRLDRNPVSSAKPRG